MAERPCGPAGLYKIIHENIALLQLAEGDRFETAAVEFLRQLGRCIRVNRATIWENYTDTNTGQLCCRQLYEWVENAVPTMGWEITHRTIYDDIPELRDKLMRNEMVNDFVRNRPLGEQKYLSGQGDTGVSGNTYLYPGAILGLDGL